MTDPRPATSSSQQGLVPANAPIVATANNIRSPGPIPQVQVIPQQMHGSPYFPFNQQYMLQNAAVQAAMGMAMNQQLNMAAAIQGRPPSVSPTSPNIMSPPSVSMAQGVTNVVTTGATTQNTGVSKQAGNGKSPQQQTMVVSKPTMMPTAQAVNPLTVFGNFGVPVLQSPVSSNQAFNVGQQTQSKGQTVTVAQPGQHQLISSQAPLRLNNQSQLVTNTGQIITSQPMLTNQVLQAMANLQQGIPLSPHQQLLTNHGQSQAILAGQSLYIRAAGPFQTPQNMMAANMPNFAAANITKANKVVDVQQAPQVKQNTTVKSTIAAPPGKALLPSVTKTAKIQPTQVAGQMNQAQLNIPSVPKTKHRSKSTSVKTTVPASPAAVKISQIAAVAKPTNMATNGQLGVKSQSDSEVEVVKKAPLVTATIKEMVMPQAKVTEVDKMDTVMEVTEMEKEKELLPASDDKVVLPSADKPVVEKQKAIVKPHILTHVIEGFVIQEGYEPFPVQRTNQMSEFIPPKPCRNDKESEDDFSESFDENPPPLLDAHDALVGNREPPTLKCEFCGKIDLAFKFRCSKRFCSRPCAKRYNVGCSKRMGIYPAKMGGRYIRKRKHVFVKKGWRPGRGGRLTYNIHRMLPNDEDKDNQEQVAIDEMSSSNSNQDSSSSPASPSNPQDIDVEMEEQVEQSASTTNPAKWTVAEVCDFINNLQGCASIAEEFRSQEIDGQALLLLNEDHLMTNMNIKLGPALKICAKINSLKDCE